MTSRREPVAIDPGARAPTAAEEHSLFNYYESYIRYAAMRLLVCADNGALLARFAAGAARVLELGCGSLPARLGAEGPPPLYLGIDISAEGLRLARRLAPQGYYCVGDAGRPALRDGSFDLVLAKNLLHHLGRPVDCLHAARRLLAPGGRIVILEPNPACVTANLGKWALRLLGRDVEASPYGQLSGTMLTTIIRESGLVVTAIAHAGYLAFPLSGDYGRVRLLPMSLPLWRALVALERTIATALSRARWLAPYLGFKVIFELRPS